MVKISKTKHITRKGVIKRNPSIKPTKSELIRKYKKVDKEHSALWDKYFGKTPLSNPSKNKSSHTPQNKAKLIKKIREREKLKKIWEKCGYNKR